MKTVEEIVRETPKVPYKPPTLPTASDFEEMLRAMNAIIQPACAQLRREYDKELRK